MLRWIQDRIRECETKMQAAAAAHALTVYAEQAARKKAFEECEAYLRGAVLM